MNGYEHARVLLKGLFTGVGAGLGALIGGYVYSRYSAQVRDHAKSALCLGFRPWTAVRVNLAMVSAASKNAMGCVHSSLHCSVVSARRSCLQWRVSQSQLDGS